MKRWWWLLPGIAGIAMTLLIMVVLPPDRTIDNLWEFFYKISPLVLAVLAIAGFPQQKKLGLLLLGLLVAGYMGVVDSLNITHISNFAGAEDHAAAFPTFYQFNIFVNAFVVVAVLFGYRLGGGSTANVLKAGFAGILIVVSGLNDLTHYYTADWGGPRPERLDWASHITVFVGGPPTPTVAIIFCVVHLLLAALILLLPTGRRSRQVSTAGAVTPALVSASPTETGREQPVESDRGQANDSGLAAAGTGSGVTATDGHDTGGGTSSSGGAGDGGGGGGE